MATPYLPTEQAVAQSSPEILGLERQRKLADLLTAQAFTQPQGQMISGHYVAPSWTQQLAPLASALAGGAIAERADKQQQELASALRGKQAIEIEKFGELEKTDKAAALRYALSTDNPTLREIAKEELKGIKLGKGDVFTRTSLGGGTTKLEGNPDLPDSIQYAISIGQLPQNPATWTPQQAAIAKNIVESKARAGASSMNLGQHGFDNTLKLGDKFTSEPIYKAYQEVRQAYQQVNKSLDENTAVGDVAAATKIAKLLDPTSVVRETELATIANAKGTIDRLAQLSEYVMTGKTLGPEQRKEFRSLAKQFYDVAGTQYNETRNKYSEIGKRNDLGDVETVLGAPYKPTTGGKWGTATVEKK